MFNVKKSSVLYVIRFRHMLYSFYYLIIGYSLSIFHIYIYRDNGEGKTWGIFSPVLKYFSAGKYT